MFCLLSLRSHVAENTYYLNYKSAFFGIKECLTENTVSVTETNQCQHRMPSGKILFLSAFRQNWNVIYILERKMQIWNVVLCLLDPASSRNLNKDRPTWCHTLYYSTIYCSTCFECWYIHLQEHATDCGFISCVVLLWFDVCWCYGVVRLGWSANLMQAEAQLQPA